MKAPILIQNYKGVALSWRGPHPPPFKFLIFFLSDVVEVDEVKNECFISNFPISEFQKSLAFD